MSTAVRGVAVTGIAALTLVAGASTGHAGQGNERKSGHAAQTQHAATDTFIDTVPCASDTGLFRITLTYNGVERFTDRRGHFTQTGTFLATPVLPTVFDEETHDGETHRHPVDGVPRPGDTYSGRFTIGGSFNANRNATTETFRFRLKGTSSDGETVVSHALYHQTTVKGETRSLIERERCR